MAVCLLILLNWWLQTRFFLTDCLKHGIINFQTKETSLQMAIQLIQKARKNPRLATNLWTIRQLQLLINFTINPLLIIRTSIESTTQTGICRLGIFVFLFLNAENINALISNLHQLILFLKWFNWHPWLFFEKHRRAVVKFYSAFRCITLTVCDIELCVVIYWSRKVL